jgi:hypothetical protein
MEIQVFMLLMDRIKCWLNAAWQVLTKAPALHSLNIRWREDVECILEVLFDSNVNIRKLIMKNCVLGEDVTSLLTNIVAFYPDLEALSLAGCHPLTYDAYCLIPCLKKLSELNLSHCEVHYVYVKLLEIHICRCEHVEQNTARNTFCIFMQEGNLQHFKTCQNVSFFCTKWHLFCDFIIVLFKYYIFHKPFANI